MGTLIALSTILLIHAFRRRRVTLPQRLAGRIIRDGDLVDELAGWCARADADETWRILDGLRAGDS